MRLSPVPGTIEPRRARRRRWFVAGGLLVFALLAGTLALLAVAYVQQSNKVDDLESQNRQILVQHVAIGTKFAEQSKRLEQESRRLEGALRSSFQRGFRAGQEAMKLPRPLRPLARFGAAQILIPRRIPAQLSRKPRVETHLDGYALHWPGIGAFASTTDPLEVWTRQAIRGVARAVPLGGHRVERFVGPSGLIFAWRERACTYAVIALPQREGAARALIRAMH
jgi:hypothetical protein